MTELSDDEFLRVQALRDFILYSGEKPHIIEAALRLARRDRVIPTHIDRASEWGKKLIQTARVQK